MSVHPIAFAMMSSRSSRLQAFALEAVSRRRRPVGTSGLRGMGDATTDASGNTGVYSDANVEGLTFADLSQDVPSNPDVAAALTPSADESTVDASTLAALTAATEAPTEIIPSAPTLDLATGASLSASPVSAGVYNPATGSMMPESAVGGAGIYNPATGSMMPSAPAQAWTADHQVNGTWVNSSGQSFAQAETGGAVATPAPVASSVWMADHQVNGTWVNRQGIAFNGTVPGTFVSAPAAAAPSGPGILQSLFGGPPAAKPVAAKPTAAATAPGTILGIPTAYVGLAAALALVAWALSRRPEPRTYYAPAPAQVAMANPRGRIVLVRAVRRPWRAA